MLEGRIYKFHQIFIGVYWKRGLDFKYLNSPNSRLMVVVLFINDIMSMHRIFIFKSSLSALSLVPDHKVSNVRFYYQYIKALIFSKFLHNNIYYFKK